MNGWTIATDSEWDRTLPDPWISTAFCWADGTVVFVRDDVPGEVRERLDATAEEVGAVVRYVPRNDGTNLTALIEAPPDSRLLIYFSPKDVEYAVGWQAFKSAIDREEVRQSSGLSGRVGKVVVKDVGGWAGKTSLVKFASGLGVTMANKASMDEYKAHMWQGLVRRPEDFLRYAVDDARVLLRVRETFVDLFRAVQRDVLGMGDADLWTADDIPMTCGALVAKTFERWLHTSAGELRDVFKVCVRKLGVLDPDAKGYARSREAYQAVVNGCRTADAVRAMQEAGNEDMERFLRARFLFNGLTGSHVRWWASRPSIESQSFNALVQGGRCLNENPFEYEIERGLDVDISGCYGDALRELVFPVGLPSVWSWTPNQERPTFGSWIDRHGDELVDGLWCAVVSGPLTFEQDLVFSKLAKASDIRKSVGKDRADEDDIDADFVMLRREIVNGIITADVLKVLRSVATNAEWATFRTLRMVTATAYTKQDRKNSLGEWCDAVLRDKGGVRTTKQGRGDVVDDRTRAWYGIPLEGFSGKLVEERKRYKRLISSPDVSEAEKARAIGISGTLKLLVNTLYGDLASRFFGIGNTTVANNITARARVGVWMMAKALGTRQSITDGGIYTPEAVCGFNPERRPGLDTLSRQWAWADRRRGRTLVPLGGKDWAALWDAMPPADEVDALALAHVRRFWQPYGIDFPFRLEHKRDNQCDRASYWSKADYALHRRDGYVEHWLRGKTKNKKTDEKPHPSFALLSNIIDGVDDFPKDLSYTKGGVLKVGKYRVIQASAGYEDMKAVRPGDNIPVREYQARYNNTHFPLDTVKDYHRRRDRKKVNHGKQSHWFERHGDHGISGVHDAMSRDSLRD